MKQLLFNRINLACKSGTKLLPAFLLMFYFGQTAGLYAQMALSAESMALGGGGTAYHTGYESLFINPANLFISEKKYSYQFSLFQGALYHDTLLPIDDNVDRLNNFFNRLGVYSPDDSRSVLDDDSRELLIERNFGEERVNSVFTSRSDVYWFGLKWVRPKRSYALSLRSRFANRYELGRGLYSNFPLERNNTIIFDQSFRQQFEVLHELSFGFAESFTYLNGLIPGLSEFIVGVAPKVVLSGGYLNTTFQNRYNYISEGAYWQRDIYYSQQTTGILSDYAEDFFTSRSGSLSANNHSFRNLLHPTGAGLGLDIGITYLITFGDDLSVLRRQDVPTNQSLRLSFSITDLGAVYFYDNPYDIRSHPLTVSTNNTDNLRNTEYGGALNEHYQFVKEYGDQLIFSSDSLSQDNFNNLLPTAINAGALFQFKRIKLMGDLSYSVSESAFNPHGLSTYFGFEIRPIRAIPLRSGTRLAAGMPGYFSFGAGLETSRFDFNAAIQVKSRNSGPTSEIVAASLLGIKLYFQ